MQLFNKISATEFFADYWQKQPLLLKDAFPNFISPLSPDELAGLACEEDVESRLVLEKGGEKPWQVLSGPFEESVLSRLPDTHWSLSVQGLERIIPDISAILDSFSFLPNWLFDDVLLSYAPDQGSVGAHIDNYDVFILQAQGSRRWLLEAQPQWDEEYQEDLDIRLLKSFSPTLDFELGNGDLLYIPRRFAHHGIALGECLNYSVGFRAPSDSSLLQSFLSWSEGMDSSENFLSFPISKPQKSRGEVSQEALSANRALLKDMIDSELFSEFLGCYLSEPKSYFPPVNEEEKLDGKSLRKHLTSAAEMVFLEGSKRLWVNNPVPRLFIDGEELKLRTSHPKELFSLICDSGTLELQCIIQYGADSEANWAALAEQFNNGLLSIRPSEAE